MDPMEITGYLTQDDAEALRLAVADVDARQVPGNVVEVGSFHGRSTVILAQALRDSGRLLLAIDPHEGVLNGVDGRSMMAVEPTLAALRSNLDRFGVADLVQVHVGTVDDAPLPALIALAFVDGLHDAEHARHDAEALFPQMAPGGLLLFHDYNAQWPGVMEAVADMWHDHGLVWAGALGNVARMMIRG
jgi:predicted O-methyltransferase YrrM